jgi:predicted amidohydrolase/DNA-binding SARP family transcriptional activator/TolB-like protein
VHLALASLAPVWEDKAASLGRCRVLVARAAAKGAKLVAFPELTLTGFSMKATSLAETAADSPTIRAFAELAREHRLAIAFGLVLEGHARPTNSLVVLDRAGAELARYAKLHPFAPAGEDVCYESGERTALAAVDDVVFGLSICYDLRFPEPYTSLAERVHAQLVIASWPSRGSRTGRAARAKAIEGQCWVIGVNRTGEDRRTAVPPSPCVFDPGGVQLAPDWQDDGSRVAIHRRRPGAEQRRRFPYSRPPACPLPRADSRSERGRRARHPAAARVTSPGYLEQASTPRCCRTAAARIERTGALRGSGRGLPWTNGKRALSFLHFLPHAPGPGMIDIALLGGVSVSVDGVPLTGEAAQRRRVALLALLAAPSLRSLSRDRLIGWLWPDHDPESARRLLSAALHVLRKALGHDALVTSSDDVALNPSLVHVDAVEFRCALGSGEVERALTLYGGEFMDGFFVNDAADFGQWVDGERSELKRLYGDALEHAAGQRAGAANAAGAAEAWRRRAALDPYDARVALQLMKALAAAGQRGAAIQHARLHAQLLEQEFGAQPDPQVEALALELRQAPVQQAPTEPPASAAARPAAATGEHGAPPQAAPVAADQQSALPPAPQVTGIRLASEGAAPGLPPVRAGNLGRQRKVTYATVVIAALLIALSIAFWPRPSVLLVVRPFGSSEDSLARYGPALAGELWAELGRIESLKLIHRDVAFSMAGRDPRDVIRELDADALLDGTLHREGSRYSLALELTGPDAVDLINSDIVGVTLLELQHAIVDTLAEYYGRGLREESAEELAEEAAEPEARSHFLAARTAWLERARAPQLLWVALHEYYQALLVDAKYARAWAGLAEAYDMLGSGLRWPACG